MKTINLPALGQITLLEVNSFLYWLEQNLNSEVSPNHMEKNAPIRTSKLNPMFKVLDQFGFVSKKENRIKITMSGKEFSDAPLSVKKVVVRTLFLKVEQIQKLVELLKNSATGRLQRRVINEAFDMGSLSHIAESEVLAFISWGQACELFNYDSKKEEIFQIDSSVPIDPKGSGVVGQTIPTPARLVS